MFYFCIFIHIPKVWNLSTAPPESSGSAIWKLCHREFGGDVACFLCVCVCEGILFIYTPTHTSRIYMVIYGMVCKKCIGRHWGSEITNGHIWARKMGGFSLSIGQGQAEMSADVTILHIVVKSWKRWQNKFNAFRGWFVSSIYFYFAQRGDSWNFSLNLMAIKYRWNVLFIWMYMVGINSVKDAILLCFFFHKIKKISIFM